MKLAQPINIKIFFTKQEVHKESLTYNHYGVVEKEDMPNGWLRLKKNNGEEAIINLANVNQIITI